MPLITIIKPDSEPVTVDDVKAAARIDAASFDDQLADLLIPAIRGEVEHRLGRRLITQTVEVVCASFPSQSGGYGAIDLQIPDVQSIVSIKYLDPDSVEQTVPDTDYSLDSDSKPSQALLAAGKAWPATAAGVPNAVRVRCIAGYGDSPTDVPGCVRLWIIAHVIQALETPSGLSAHTVQPLANIDRLLDAEMIVRAA